MKTQNTKNTNTNAQSVQTSKQASKKTSKQASEKTSKQATQKQASENKQASEKKQIVKIETLYNNMKQVIDLSKFDNVDSLAINELNFNEFVINQVINNNLIALVKIYAHKNRYDLLLNKSRLTMLFNNALNANKLLNVDFNASKLEKKKQYVVELNLQQLEQYICILFDLTKKQEQTTKQ